MQKDGLTVFIRDKVDFNTNDIIIDRFHNDNASLHQRHKSPPYACT